MALIIASCVSGEKWAIVTGSQPKSDVIMGKVIEHLFDHQYFTSLLEYDKDDFLDRLKRERSKQNLIFRNGGAIKTFTADSRNRTRVKEALMGFGSPNIIEDESALIPDDLQSTVLRMLGGYDGGYLVKIGNPFFRNHFYRTWNSEKYKKVFIDYKQGLKEGRYTPDFIEEMRQEAFFDILYECKFPNEDEIDMDGFVSLLKGEEVARAKVITDHVGTRRLGVDIGEGGDKTVAILRSDSYAEIVHESRTTDLMATTKVIVDLIEDYKVDSEQVFVDATGIGSGVCSRLNELEKFINAVKWGERSEDSTYANKKAEAFWRARTWLVEKGKLQPHDGFNELLMIKYKKDSGGRVIIKSKEQMRSEGKGSPDFADAFAFTFNECLADTAPNITVI